MGLLSWWLRRAYTTWVAWQVELHGQFSFERLHNLLAYSQRTSTPRAVAITLVTPIPCIVLVTLIDCVPLADPQKGTNANYVHWVRNFATIALMSYAILKQFRYTVPGLPLTLFRLNTVAILASLGGVGFQFLMSHAIGFPLPFSIVVGTPVWTVVIVALFYYYFAALVKENTQFGIDLSNYMFVFFCQVALTFIYPAYVYGFQSLDPEDQRFYVLLLPLLKILLRNWISRFLGEFDDLKPEIMIFNVEIFNALYVSCCMQRSSSIGTTLIVSLGDWAIALLSFRDITHIHADVAEFMDLIPRDHAWHSLNFMEVAHRLIQEDPFVQGHPSLKATCKNSGQAMFFALSKKTERVVTKRNYSHSPLVVPVAAASSSLVESVEVKSQRSEGHLPSRASTKYLPPLDKPPRHEGASAGAAAPEEPTQGSSEFFNEQERLHFVQSVVQLLYTTEFVALLEYTVVVAPVIYSVYLATVYHLKNRMYYAQLASIDADDLQRTISNVLVYAVLQYLAFIAMSVALKKRLGISVFKQVAFVLEGQWTVVHSKILLWFFYCVQNSLHHFGADYSFRFAWLSLSSSSSQGGTPVSPPT